LVQVVSAAHAGKNKPDTPLPLCKGRVRNFV
jgi:hypothetical protein